MKNTLSLKEPRYFQKTINKGNWYGGNLISTYILSNNAEDANVNYIGLAVGKKAGKATKRNKVKRIIRAVYTGLEDRINKGYTFVFVWKSKAKYEDLSFQTIKRDMERAFSRAKLLK